MRTILVFSGLPPALIQAPPKHPHRSPAVTASVCPECSALPHRDDRARSGEPFLWLIERVSFGRIPNLLCDTVWREQAIAPDAWKAQRQDVEEKAAHELVRFHRRDAA